MTPSTSARGSYRSHVTDGHESPLDRLSVEDIDVVRQCLAAAVRGPFFPDWEFSTLFGHERDEVAGVLERWPDRENPEDQDVAVSNTLNWLLGYPHERWDVWGEFISVAPREVAPVMARWVGEDELDISTRGYFNRLR